MFLLKKMVSNLLYPLPFLFLVGFVIIILIIFTKKDKLIHGLSIAFITLLAVFSFKPIPRFFTRKLERKYDALLVTPADVSTIVVLGGGSCADNALPTSSQLTSASLTRLTEGIVHFNELDSARLIVTGGAIFDSVTIASLQRRMAIKLGVDSNHIAMADSALDTEMEARAVRKMVTENRIILVTSATHMNRSVSLFKKVGFDPIPAPTNHKVHDAVFSPGDIFPSGGNILMFKKTVHEYLGMIWSKLRGRT